MKGVLLRSIENKEKIVIFYMDSNEEVTQRFIRVLKINDTHILAYCFYRKKVRTFRLDNVLATRPLKKTA